MSENPAAGSSGSGPGDSAVAPPARARPEHRSLIDRVRAERAVLADVSAMRTTAARARLAGAEHDELFALLADADIRYREGHIDIAELQTLRDLAGQQGQPSTLAWAWAVLADRLLITGDPAAFVEARRALDTLPPETAVGDVIGQWARSRLLRVAAATYWIFPTPGGLELHRQLHSESVTRLLRCGFTDEAESSGAI